MVREGPVPFSHFLFTTYMYKFISPRQLIFKVTKSGGTQAIVYFSERAANGTSTFLTQDEEIAQAIMRHSFFAKGVIRLADSDAKERQTTDAPAPTDDASASQGPETDEMPAEAPVSEEQVTGEGVMRFPNITIAKDYLHRTYGVKKEEIRSLPKVLAYAEGKGVTIIIGD